MLGFIKLMEQYYGKRFRILIIIEDLDKCGNDKICDLFSVSSLPSMRSAWYLKQSATNPCHVFHAELTSLEYCVSHGTQAAPYHMPTDLGHSLRRGRGGSLDCMWGVKTHSGPPVFF